MSRAERETRPPLTPEMTATELRRWYWLRSELATFARTLGISASGSKVELTERLLDVLDGRPPRAVTRRATGPRVRGPLAGTTTIPPGQRCTQLLRRYLTDRIGPGFRFDGAMREVIARGGITLDELVQHWHTTREQSSTDIAPQFEYNRFTRAWRAEHPEGDREALLGAWWDHRSRPRSS